VAINQEAAIADAPRLPKKLRIRVDDREAGGRVSRKLAELGGVELNVSRLPVADFILSDRVAVERKTDADFESSVIDGRLFQQAAELKSNFESPLVCVVGNEFSRLDKRARRGALMALAIDSHIPVFFFESEESLAEFLHQLAWREQFRRPRPEKLQFSKKTLSLAQQMRLVVESLPEIGPATAEALLTHFGSVENAFTAQEEELTEVRGVGRERARLIKQITCGEYTPPTK
jgi:Fanconi anemia group M protein